MNNPAGGTDITLSTFGGTFTEMSPSDVPEGSSPDSQDVAFIPGSVLTRPGFKRLYQPTTVYGAFIADVLWQDNYTLRDGTKLNLFLTADGGLYKEDVMGDPGVFVQFGSAPFGSRCKAAKAFGRVYMTFSDGVHGSDHAYQYDGTNFDRVSQEGPAAAISVESISLPSSTLGAFPFAEIPLQGGGTIAIGAGSGASGTSIPLPDGYTVDNMVAWASPQNGYDKVLQIEGVYAATVTAGVLDAAFQKRDGTRGITAGVNWAAAAWSAGAAVTVTVSDGITYISFTTAEGDELCIANGSLTTANPTMTGVPAGFDAAHFAYIAGPASTTHTGRGLERVLQCSLDGTLTKVLTYDDNDGDHWTGSVNVFGVFWKTGGGVTTEAVTNGNAILVPVSSTETIAFIQAYTSGFYGLPTGFLTTNFLVATCAMAGGAASSDHVTHGWFSCSVSLQTFTGKYKDGENHVWAGSGNIFAIVTDGTSLFGASLTRAENVVTANTLAPHNLQPGYQAQISGVPASQIGGGIANISIVNADNPGVATVTTHEPHGLLPQNKISMTGVTGAAVGGGIASVKRAGSVVTVTTNAAHGLQFGATIKVAGVADTTYNGQFSILAVPSPTEFTFAQADVDSTSTGGTVTTVWPIADNDPAKNFFTVETTPTPTTFTISISYPDGTWTNGVITFGWDGIFYVSSVPDPTTFTYRQYGPDTFATGSGIVTPYGQAAPGRHKAVCLFQTRNGFITAPGPEVEFVANGGQYLSVSGIPIGPPNVIKRIIALTGADGSRYFYLGVAPRVGTELIGTSTTIEDNESPTALFDFGDPALLSGTAIDIEGNDLFEQVALGPVCGVDNYADRMLFYGEDNRNLELLNMGFEGGYTETTPLAGWTLSDPLAFALQPASNGGCSLRITPGGDPTISQSAYQTQIGAQILDPTQTYAFKAKVMLTVEVPDPTLGVTATLHSDSLGGAFATAVLSIPAPLSVNAWAYFTAKFDNGMPAAIPADAILKITATGADNPGNFIDLDEMALIYAKKPYNENVARVSYIINPEAFDAVTGVLGPEADSSKIQCTFTVRNTLSIVTRDNLHVTKDLASVEPGGWSVDQMENRCGAVSLYGLLTGKNWGAWASDGGVNLFGGSSVSKLSQDIQNIWDTVTLDALTSILAVNDQTNRRAYFFVPTGGVTVPNKNIVLDYRHLDDSGDIAGGYPLRTTIGGETVTSEARRKWTVWTGPCRSAGYIFKGENLTLAFASAFRSRPVPGGGIEVLIPHMLYELDAAGMSDDDYGQIPAYYVTSFFSSDDSEQGQQVGHHRHLYAFLSGWVAGRGYLKLTPLADSMDNARRPLTPYKLADVPTHDVERGMQIAAVKMGLRIEATPILLPVDETRTPRDPLYTNGKDTHFEISRLCVTVRQHPMSPVRGSSL